MLGWQKPLECDSSDWLTMSLPIGVYEKFIIILIIMKFVDDFMKSDYAMQMSII